MIIRILPSQKGLNLITRIYHFIPPIQRMPKKTSAPRKKLKVPTVSSLRGP